MFGISNLSLKMKLPLVMVTLTGTFLIAVAFFVYELAEKNIRQNVLAAQEIQAQAGAQALEFLLRSARSDLENQAVQPAVFRAISNFDRVIGMIEADDPIGYLKQTFVTDNPNAADQRDKLTDPGDGSYYTQSHVSYHPAFQRTLQLNGYDDLFLFNTQGRMVYSVKKKEGFVGEFGSGGLAKTPLGEAVAQAATAEQGQVITTDFLPYALDGGKAAAFMAAPVFNKKGVFSGVIAIRLGSGGVVAALSSNLQNADHQSIYLVSSDGVARSPSTGVEIFETLQASSYVEAAKNRQAGVFQGVTGVAGEEVVALVQPLDMQGGNWSLVMETDDQTAFAAIYQIRITALALIGGALLAAVVVSVIAARRVTKPILVLRDATNALAASDYSQVVRGRRRGDELGELARSLDSFRGKLAQADEAAAREVQAAQQTAQVVEEMSGALNELQSGNLACDIEVPFAGHYETLRQNFNRSLENLRSSMSEVVGASEHVGRFSEEQQASAGEMADRTENQAATLENTAAALRELTDGIRATADRASRMDAAMRNTRGQAENNTQIVTSAVDAMDQIQMASSEISKIIGLIDDIAFQTNLLALNAGVEAARAGEAGRGFAVVASEVRGLAQRASTAAGQIQELTGASERHVANGVEMVGRAGDALAEIIGQVSEVSGLVTEIAEGVQKQSQGLEGINSSMNQLDSVTQQNAAMAEEASAASQLLQNEARTLSGIVSRFQLGNSLPVGFEPGVTWQNSGTG